MADTETVIQETSGTDTAESQERTFTQSELDDIIKARVAKERAKYGDYETLQAKASKFDEMEEASKSELQKATERAEALQRQLDEMSKANEVRGIRDKVSIQTGVPTSLLSAETEEDCVAQAEAILAFAQKPSATYPSVKDGGEVANIPDKPKTNGEMFGEWLGEQLSR